MCDLTKEHHSISKSWSKVQKKHTRLFELLRFVVIVILPLIYGMYVLSHKETINTDANGVLEVIDRVNQTSSFQVNATILSEVSDTARLDSKFPLVRYLDFYPFTSSSYEFCINNSGSNISYSDGYSANDVYFEIGFETGNRTLKPNEEICSPINTAFRLSEKPIIVTQMNHVDLSNKNSSINVIVDLKPRLVTYRDYGLLQGITMISLGVLSLWLPLTEIIRKIKGGFLT